MKKALCKKFRKMAGEYNQNLLKTNLASQVEGHLSECPSCRKDFEETRKVLTLLKGDRLADPGPDFWDGLSSRIMTQVRLSRSEATEDPWYKKVWRNPFTWPGYAWATALILMLLTPVAIYTIHIQGYKAASVQEIKGPESKWETGLEPLSVAVESLSTKESVRLAKKVVARLGKDLPGPTRLSVEDEMHWDISRSLEGLNNEELETLIKKMQPGGSAGLKEEENYAC
ncbi:MAG: hypothetical protein MUQ20_04710 [Deltaproteobacteria bacterium]|nr:hypothetical protein [Deltaproteobacteria bacterium]